MDNDFSRQGDKGEEAPKPQMTTEEVVKLLGELGIDLSTDSPTSRHRFAIVQTLLANYSIYLGVEEDLNSAEEAAQEWMLG